MILNVTYHCVKYYRLAEAVPMNNMYRLHYCLYVDLGYYCLVFLTGILFRARFYWNFIDIDGYIQTINGWDSLYVIWPGYGVCSFKYIITDR